jgi:hypothetical protein
VTYLAVFIAWALALLAFLLSGPVAALIVFALVFGAYALYRTEVRR